VFPWTESLRRRRQLDTTACTIAAFSLLLALLHAQSLAAAPALPQVFLDTSYAPPTGGILITVNAGGDLLIGSVRCINTPCVNLETTVDWPTTGLAAGPHSLYAVATDTFGNSSSSAPITVAK
jgi:hypothetical protein